VLGLSGGVACYKSAELCRALVKAGASVQVVMTEAATQFITPVTMQALSNRPVYTRSGTRASPTTWRTSTSRARPMPSWWRRPAPTSSPKLAQGRADELLSLLCLARPRERVPLLLAPAMNREMWAHPATQRNVAQAARRRRHGARPVGNGDQACGETGDGRMLEPEELLRRADRLLPAQAAGGP
jgi:phosphopantothenoylcysteine decarboxylase/phosphopantothenate--cysteine ligase